MDEYRERSLYISSLVECVYSLRYFVSQVFETKNQRSLYFPQTSSLKRLYDYVKSFVSISMKIRLPIPSRNTFTTIILEWLEKLYKINNSVTSRFITVSYGLNGVGEWTSRHWKRNV